MKGIEAYRMLESVLKAVQTQEPLGINGSDFRDLQKLSASEMTTVLGFDHGKAEDIVEDLLAGELDRLGQFFGFSLRRNPDAPALAERFEKLKSRGQ